MLPNNTDYSHILRTEILGKMREGIEKNTIQCDETLIQFGSETLEKIAHIPERDNYLRNKLREMARFMLEVRKLNRNITKLSDVIDPHYFPIVVDATLNLAGFNRKTNEFSTPTLAKKVGESIQKCAAILKKMQ